ncbi:hypothetical protein [Roseimaritima multifibrata]|uniref:hypothetical protein n=1 Tax=Roseimaritima multifibrata TaxID=1930274 RepID=UPI001C54CBBA|nr:hypothetical protein [Roseimaritima multifibrata]
MIITFYSTPAGTQGHAGWLSIPSGPLKVTGKVKADRSFRDRITMPDPAAI